MAAVGTISPDARVRGRRDLRRELSLGTTSLRMDRTAPWDGQSRALSAARRARLRAELRPAWTNGGTALLQRATWRVAGGDHDFRGRVFTDVDSFAELRLGGPGRKLCGNRVRRLACAALVAVVSGG